MFIVTEVVAVDLSRLLAWFMVCSSEEDKI